MRITLDPSTQSVTITMTPVQYDLLAAGVQQDATMLERLLMSHCQQIQRAQDETKRHAIQQVMEMADPAQLAAALSSMTAFHPVEAVTKG